SFYPPEDIFTIRPDGSDDRNVSATPDDESEPQWSPDGLRISYRSYDSPGGRLVIRAIGDGDATVSMPIDSTFQSMVWSPDARLLLIVGNMTPSSDNIPSRLSTIDSHLSGLPKPLLDVPHNVSCVSWQPVFR